MEKGQLKIFNVGDAKEIANVDLLSGGLFTCDFSPNGKEVAAAGFDGQVRIIDASNGKMIKTLTPVPLELAKK